MDRGILRVYLGAAPGVGKTFAMLAEGHRRRDRGTDVLVGYVETHGRARTLEALGDLEVIPRARIAYAGTIQEELDLDAILQRHPTVVLVDELAHTNVPGSRHTKRWQDVDVLLEAGIEVITTVNIQHLESLNDVTDAVTGVRQRETVPDFVVRRADQIELVDMSPQALRRRMAHGNVYPADKVDAALANYFREGNLTALRELALLWLADQVDEGMERYREQHKITGTWPTRERVVVAITGGPESLTLMRRAARIATRRSGGEWLAIYATRDDGLIGVSPHQLASLRTKVEELGGSFHTVVGNDPAETILAFARAENANQVIVGASRRGRLSVLLRPGIGERVIAAAGDIDVLVVTHDYARKHHAVAANPDRSLDRRRRLLGFGFAIVVPALASLALLLTHSLHGLASESMVLMAVVVATAIVGGLLPAIIAAVLSGVLLNLLFTPPLYRLTIDEPANALAIGMFVVVGIAVASVVDVSARRTSEARRARAEADSLTVLAHSLLNSSDDMAGLLASATEVLGARGAAILRQTDAGTEPPVIVTSVGTAPLTAAQASMTTLIDDTDVLALSGGSPSGSAQALLNAYAAYAKVIIERHRAAEAEADRLRLADADRTRTALLAAVSHDLRTPLASAKAAVSSLRSPDVRFSAEDQSMLLETIEESTDRLTALVSNLLDMSRIHTGAITVHLAPVNVDEAVRHAIAPLPGSGRIDVDLDLSLTALADPGLLDRVIAGICENALKYTPPTAAIRVDGDVLDDRMVLRIADRGPGLADRDQNRLFVPFQRLGDVPNSDGVGLGLAVARGLTEAMGGELNAEDTPGGGLTFVLDLPGAEELP